jgi:dTDP-4-dehydrorhamnose 3,5-epimerase
MRFKELEIKGVFAVEAEPAIDERGDFARLFCSREFASHGLVDSFVQINLSRNIKRGTVRGLHFQAAPFCETKLVRCIRGSVFDVVIDLRPNSPTIGRWLAIELSQTARNAVYVPAGCAHGYQTLLADCEVEYLVTPEYTPSAARGVRWDDPGIGIDWPIKVGVTLSLRDRQLPVFDAAAIEV